MAQSIQVLSDRTVAVDMRYPHLVEAVRNGEIDLDLYTKTMEIRKYSIETEELFPANVVATTQEKEETTKALVDTIIVVFTTMLVLVLIMLMLS